MICTHVFGTVHSGYIFPLLLQKTPKEEIKWFVWILRLPDVSCRYAALIGEDLCTIYHHESISGAAEAKLKICTIGRTIQKTIKVS